MGAVHKRYRRVSWGATPELPAAGVSEIEARATAYGLPPIVWPVPYPVNSLTAMRAATSAVTPGSAAGARWAYRFGTAQLNVHGPGADPDPVARIPVAPGNSDLCFEWPGPIESASTHLREHAIEIEQGPVSRNGAKGRGTSVYVRDPDGSLLEFISYVALSGFRTYVPGDRSLMSRDIGHTPLQG